MKCYSLTAGLEYSTSVPRLKLTLSNGRRILLPYYRIHHADWSQDGTVMTFDSGVLHFEGIGERLDDLMQFFQNDCIRHLHCFNPETHIPDETTPILHTLREVI